MSESLSSSSHFRPTTLDEAADCVRQSSGRIRIEGKGTKPALNAERRSVLMSLSTMELVGITDYQPTEFTITVLGGTPLSTIDAALAAEGQYLPFDPPWLDEGATIGGTIAAGINGPARLRYGGARDFMIGIRMVDGLGLLVTGGGKVVKNAAGFDFPKMVVGSCGRLGLLAELTLKIFPRPATYRTLIWHGRNLDHGLSALQSVMRCGCELTALELLPTGEMWIRFSGPDEATKLATANLQDQLDRSVEAQVLDHGSIEQQQWKDARDCRWLPLEHRLIKIPITPQRLPLLDRFASQHVVERRYGAAGNVAWLAWPNAQPLNPLESSLIEQQLSGLVVRGVTDRSRLGFRPSVVFAERVQRSIDPNGRFE